MCLVKEIQVVAVENDVKNRADDYRQIWRFTDAPLAPLARQLELEHTRALPGHRGVLAIAVILIIPINKIESVLSFIVYVWYENKVTQI